MSEGAGDALGAPRVRWVGIACALACSGCAPTRVVAPLERGQWEVGLSVTEAVVQVAPLPLVSLHGARGITDRVTAHAGVGLSSLAYGDVHLDPGLTVGVVTPDGTRPGLSVAGVVNMLWDWRGKPHQVFPELTASAYWSWGASHRQVAHVGITSWFDVAGRHPLVLDDRLWLPAAQVGWRIMWGHVGLVVEARWLGFTLSRAQTTMTQGWSVGDQGALAGHLGAVVRF